jgi:hypothetical protein
VIPPKLVLNPAFFPAGGNVHTGTGYYNSGPIFTAGDPPQAGPRSYSLTFTQPGRYEYICITHYNLGMDASVVVSSAGGGAPPPGMPTTGAALDFTVWLALAGFGLLLAVLGVSLRGRKARKAA